MVKEKVLAALMQGKNDQGHEYDEILKKIREGDSQDVVRHLLELAPDDIGGRTALAGFYYQFLITCEYIIEMLDGKWDFVAYELHEDIIVGKGNNIRFIQVKASKDTDKLASESLIKRDTKIFNGQKLTLGNSWIDKLISKAKYFPKCEGFQTQFQLLTSFVVRGSQKMNIFHYTKNENFSMHIEDDDDLLKFLSEEIYTNEGEKINYASECKEDVKSLLSRFYLKKHIDLCYFKKYENDILLEFSKRIGDGIRVSEDHLAMIIGKLMKNCASIGDNLVLFITKSEANELLQTLHDQAISVAENTTRLHGNVKLLEEVFDHLVSQLSESPMYKHLEKYINEYREYIISWIKGGGSIRELINRYIDGKKYSSVYRKLDEFDKRERLFELFSTNLLFILIYEEIIKFSEKSSSLLVKEIQDELISYLSLNRRDTLEDGIEKLKNIFQDNVKSITEIIKNSHKIILQGNFRGNKKNPRRIEIEDIDMDVKSFPKSAPMDKVNIVLDIIPGGTINEKFDNIFDFDSIDEFRKDLEEFWQSLKEGIHNESIRNYDKSTI
jgi:hypothetical protein